jgi:hypothetical protein
MKKTATLHNLIKINKNNKLKNISCGSCIYNNGKFCNKFQKNIFESIKLYCGLEKKYFVRW